MGRIDAIISDELEKQLRMKAVQEFGGKKGSLMEALEHAMILWVSADAPKKERSAKPSVKES